MTRCIEVPIHFRPAWKSRSLHTPGLARAVSEGARGGGGVGGAGRVLSSGEHWINVYDGCRGRRLDIQRGLSRRVGGIVSTCSSRADSYRSQIAPDMDRAQDTAHVQAAEPATAWRHQVGPGEVVLFFPSIRESNDTPCPSSVYSCRGSTV
jgi:hypothetical protein